MYSNVLNLFNISGIVLFCQILNENFPCSLNILLTLSFGKVSVSSLEGGVFLTLDGAGLARLFALLSQQLPPRIGSVMSIITQFRALLVVAVFCCNGAVTGL